MITKKNRDFIYQLLFGVIIFLVPSNLFLKFFESSAYVNGLLIDYLIPKLYLTDIVIKALFLWWLFDNRKSLKKRTKKIIKKTTKWIKENRLGSFLIVALILRQFNADHNISAYWYLLKMIEVGLLGLVFINKKKLINHALILSSTIFALMFQSGIAILQYLNQSSLVGYKLLGEPNLSKQIGLAKQTIDGVEKILPYGTTAHPNILGGVIALFLLLIIGTLVKPKLLKKNYHKQPFIYGPILIALYTLWLTHSISAWFTLAVGILLIFKTFDPKKVLSTALLTIILSPIAMQIGSAFTDNPSIKRRAYLNHAAITMLFKNPIWGVGLNNFTSRVEEYSPTREVVRFTQPSHHVLFLALSEVGLLGLVITITLCPIAKKLKKKISISSLIKKIKQKINTIEGNENMRWGSTVLAILTPILVLDHYLITTQSGLLLGLITILVTKNFLFPLRK